MSAMTTQEKNELPHTLKNRKAPIYLDYQDTMKAQTCLLL